MFLSCPTTITIIMALFVLTINFIYDRFYQLVLLTVESDIFILVFRRIPHITPILRDVYRSFALGHFSWHRIKRFIFNELCIPFGCANVFAFVMVTECAFA